MAGHQSVGTKGAKSPSARPSTPPRLSFGYYAAASPKHTTPPYVLCSPVSYRPFTRGGGDLVQGSPSSYHPICAASYTGQVVRQNPPSPSTILHSVTIPHVAANPSDFSSSSSSVFPGLLTTSQQKEPSFFPSPSLAASVDPPSSSCLSPTSAPSLLSRQTAHSPSAHSNAVPRLEGAPAQGRRCSFSPRHPLYSNFQSNNFTRPLTRAAGPDITTAGGPKLDLSPPPPSNQTDQVPSSTQLEGRLVSSPTRTMRLQRLLQTAIYGGVYMATVEAEFGNSKEGWGGTALTTAARQKKRVAVKVMNLELNNQSKESLQEDAFGELKYHTRMKGHRNVLVYEEVFQDNQLLYVVLPYAEYEDLFEILKKRPRPFDEGETRWIFWQLLHGADFLHSHGIAFRDHSLENVLMFHQKDDGTVYPKITDPGQATLLEYNTGGSVRKLVYDKTFGKSFRPPEVYSSSTYDPITVDAFCLGWMLFYCLTKNQLFDKAQDVDKHWQLLKAGRYAELLRARGGLHLTSYVRDLLFKMMCPNPAYRLTVRQAIAHPWFRNGPHVQVDDRTVYGLTHTAERLGPHPKQLQKLRQEQQARSERRMKGATTRGEATPEGSVPDRDGSSTTASVMSNRSSPLARSSPRLMKFPSRGGGVTRCNSGRSANSPAASTAASLRTSIPSDEVMSPGGGPEGISVD
eukprot:GHVS01020158.1.p1 GENE.GHVS01020158.1~~GHVS01020158.1.p1  ORF type:complete len:702 (+),score=118.92 GHVS01020158.1:50-2107(+)